MVGTLTRIDQNIHLSEYSQAKQLFTGFVRFPHHLRESTVGEGLRLGQKRSWWPAGQAGGSALLLSHREAPRSPER